VGKATSFDFEGYGSQVYTLIIQILSDVLNMELLYH